MNQLTTTNNQFTLEETLMEKVFEASGYKLTIVTPMIVNLISLLKKYLKVWDIKALNH